MANFDVWFDWRAYQPASMKNPFETPEEAASRKAAAKRGNECMLREPWDFVSMK